MSRYQRHGRKWGKKKSCLTLWKYTDKVGLPKQRRQRIARRIERLHRKH